MGSWQALWEYGKKDGNGNVVVGDVEARNVSNSYIHTTKRKVVALGVSDCVIVETPDAVLVMNRERCRDINRDIKLVIDSLSKEYV